MQNSFAPGTLIRARGREWTVVETIDDGQALALRPLGASDSDVQIIIPALEHDISMATFDLPDIARPGTSAEARLLREALLLTLRRGAGPFRSFGRVTFDPRAYQLAPLLMALKLDPVRLLIADDVGIGKTVEAGLIARELFDRGEIARMSVLCPPHLVDQWAKELSSKFGFDPTEVTASNAARLERGLRVGTSLFEEHPITVVSLDFIKQAGKRDEFARVCPELVIVDEAHACVGGGDGRGHQRFQLLKRLAERTERHLLLLTATPHSGDAEAFTRLAALLDTRFSGLEASTGNEHQRLRESFGDHYIQRRRADIDAWKEPGLFPTSLKKDAVYRLHADAAKFYEDVLDYCAEVTERVGADKRRRRLAFWGTLALMRCVSSSPQAALQALRSRAKLEEFDEQEQRLLEIRAFDSEEDDFSADDTEPRAIDDPKLQNLLEQAVELARDPKRDEKLKKVIAEVKLLVADGFKPVIFCRFIATAQAVATALDAALPDHTVEAVTGLDPSEERAKRVDELGLVERRVLVATDCLSEGINLQSWFDAVVHYDLCWNPTRHQQREGRVNRFGQKSEQVRAVLIYGENNPVDGAVLQVILRKAEKIQKATGVPVPLPDDGRAMTEALMQAVLLRRKREKNAQLALFDELPEAQTIEKAWVDASEREKRSQTIYAQRALKPEAVIPEWQKARAALGAGETTRRFLESAMQRVSSPLAKAGSQCRFRLPDDKRHAPLVGRLESAGIRDNLLISFEPGPGREYIHRTHPLVATIAEFLFERALDTDAIGGDALTTLGRCGAWVTRAVAVPTTVVLLRIRHRLSPEDGRPPMLAEEASALAWAGSDRPKRVAENGEAFALLEAMAETDLVDAARTRLLENARGRVTELMPEIEAHARARARVLLEDHERVREATMRARRTSVARVRVEAVTPVDVIGFYSLVPVVS